MTDYPSPLIPQTEASVAAEATASRPTLVRPVLATDKPSVVLLLEAIALFNSDELADMAAMLETFDSESATLGEFWLVATQQDAPVGVAYFAPERMTSGTWNLYFIGVHPAQRQTGVGTTLIQAIENMLRLRQARLLLVETSSLPDFDGTQTFYSKYGFEREARIRDFYKAGEDKIIFRKALAA